MKVDLTETTENLANDVSEILVELKARAYKNDDEATAALKEFKIALDYAHDEKEELKTV